MGGGQPVFVCVLVFVFSFVFVFEIVANHLGESMDTVQELVVSTLNKSDI